jgi:hypothetical protein
MDTITKPYHTAVCTYKATLHQHHSEVTVFKINKRHYFSINSVTLFIHLAYNNKDLSATTVMMTKTLALFFSTISANEQCFSLTTNQHKHRHKPNFSDDRRFIPALSDGHLMKRRSWTKA